MVLIHLAPFKHTFGMYGVAPTVNRWSAPEASWLKVVVFGLASWCWLRRSPRRRRSVPEPTGLLLALIGVLAIMNGVYVWLITNGPLSEEEE